MHQKGNGFDEKGMVLMKRTNAQLHFKNCHKYSQIYIPILTFKNLIGI